MEQNNPIKLLAVVFLILLASGCTGLSASAMGSFPPWFPAVIASIILSFFIVSIAYMAGTIFGVQEVVMWAKNELFQSAAVAVMLGMLLFLYAFLDLTLFPSLTENVLPTGTSAFVPGGPFNLSGNNIMLASQKYIEGVVSVISLQFTTMLYFQVAIGRFEFMMLRLMPGGVGIVINIGSAFTPLLHFIGFTLNMLGIAMWSVQLQFAILKFAEQYMLTLFLPLGIVLRSFPFTRAVGGAFIAIALGLFIVYPLTFILNMTVLHDHYDHSVQLTDLFTKFVFKVTQFDMPSAGIPMDPFNFAWYVLRMIFLSGLSIFFIPTIFLIQLIGGDSILQDIAFSVTIYAVVLPLINVFMTLTFTRAISQMLGADVNLNSITRLL